MIQPKRKRKYILAVILISLIILLISCQTNPPVVEPVKIDLVFPVFPTPQGVTMTDGIVSMPLDYWLLITEYKIDVDAVKQKYILIRE